jgi:hypothetical protein
VLEEGRSQSSRFVLINCYHSPSLTVGE